MGRARVKHISLLIAYYVKAALSYAERGGFNTFSRQNRQNENFSSNRFLARFRDVLRHFARPC